jgi:hypothetical protein
MSGSSTTAERSAAMWTREAENALIVLATFIAFMALVIGSAMAGYPIMEGM